MVNCLPCQQEDLGLILWSRVKIGMKAILVSPQLERQTQADCDHRVLWSVNLTESASL